MAEHKTMSISLTVLLFIQVGMIWSYPEPGIQKIELTETQGFGGFGKTLFKDSSLSLKGTCHYASSDKDASKKPKIKILWRMKFSSCAEKFIGTKGSAIFEQMWETIAGPEFHSKVEVHPCDVHVPMPRWDGVERGSTDTKQSAKPTIDLATPKDDNAEKKTVSSNFVSSEADTAPPTMKAVKSTAPPAPLTGKTAPEGTAPEGTGPAGTAPPSTKKKTSPPVARSVGGKGVKQDSTRKDETPVLSKKASGQPVPKTKSNITKEQQSGNEVFKAVHSGVYLLIVHAELANEADGEHFRLEVVAGFKSKYGYLSAFEWPLLPFFGVMSLLYLGYAIGWFIASCCNWRDLLRVQFWVGAVIALGMLENALFYSEYQNINNTGEEATGLVLFAEIVSSLKRSLARILVIIVSMGFGIVKPRLGPALHKILGVGVLYFVLAVIEGCFRAVRPKADPSRQQLFAFIPLAVLDSIICWWIFSALVQTTRTLRIRKNVVKLTLYRHFTNTLIFAVIASIAYMVYTIKAKQFNDCKDWSELWLDDAFWPFLFSLILLVIMVLWRPTNNNQRYAFTPLVDLDDEGDEQTLSDAFEGMKMRGMKKAEPNGNARRTKAEEDLKWVEENIPSVPSTVLPTLDSDEEIMTTKLEMSKME